MLVAKYWVKMYMMVGTDSWIMQCTHIGEAKLFGYIISTFNQNDCSWSVTAEKIKAIEALLGIKKASVYNYLKSLVKNKLLVKVGRGNYRINKEYISYDVAKKNQP